MATGASAAGFWEEDWAWHPADGSPGALGEAGALPDDELADELEELRRRLAARRAAARRLRERRRARRRLALLIAGVVVAALVAGQTLRGGGAPARHAEGRSPAEAAARTPAAPGTPRPGAHTRTLRTGDRGAAVRGLQAALAVLGFDPGGVDGDFQSGTRAALQAFERHRGLPVDGVFGAQAAAALSEALRARAVAEAATVRAGLDAALAGGRLDARTAARDRSVLARAVVGVGRLPLGSAAVLLQVLGDVGAQARTLGRPQAAVLFGTLQTNLAALAHRPPPRDATSLRAGDGLVYRFLPGHGYVFHPLLSFTLLNQEVRQGRREDARRLADALLARAVPSGAALLFQYAFSFGGPVPWESGFAQAVAADALARAGRLLGDARFTHAAAQAFRAVPQGLVRPLAGGLWIREYGWSDLAILNAQLQTLLSLRDYANVTGDVQVGEVAAGLERAARTLLPQFDRGCWSLYALGGSLASRHYDAYHVRLLRELSAATGDPSWAAVAARWAQGLRGATSCPA